MRIHFKRFISYFILLAAVLSLFSGCGKVSERPVSKTGFLLNTVVKITLYSGGDEDTLSGAFDVCREYENLFSRTIEDSEITQLNERLISDVSPDTAEVISLALEYARLSDGAFDITVEPLSALWNFSSVSPSVPDSSDVEAALAHVGWQNVTVEGNTVTFKEEYTRLDLGAIAKGYIADRIKDYLISQGVTGAIINLGGNVLCIGKKSVAENFKIGIQYPFGDDVIATAEIDGLSVVTSGVYERYFVEDGVKYHHILDTKTGYPVENGLLSVTIFSRESSAGDALSTVCFVLGLEEGMAFVDDLEDVYALFITSDYKLHFSQGLADTVKITY